MYRFAAMIAVVAGLAAAPAVAQDVGMGAEVFERCALCHDIGEGARNRQGPALTGLFGRRAASVADFPYSPALREAGEGGLVWTAQTVSEFIAKPRHFEPGTGMIFSGLKSEADIADVVAYIMTFQTPAQVELQLGQTLVETYCGACHAIGRDDQSAHEAAPPFRTLHERYDVGDLEEGLVEGLVSGHPDMPEFEFEPEQAAAIVAYLRSLE